MKLKSFIFICCFALMSSVFAANQHIHPKAAKSNATENKAVAPGACEIEIINNSYDDVTVHGIFDDGAMIDFNIYRYEAPHYINLDYYGYCHPDMYLEIYTPFYKIYSAYTRVNSTIRITPYLDKQAKASITLK